MIIGTFQLGPDIIEVIVDTNNIMFRDTSSGTTTTIHGLRLNKAGVIKEHQDLKNRKDWNEETIKRFKLKLKELKTEKERMKYIIKDLTGHGYKPLYYQQQGFRPVKIKQ